MSRTATIESAFYSKYWEFICRGNSRLTLLSVLASHLPHISPTEWPERLAWGGVFVNGLAASGDLSLPDPSRVEYYEPLFNFRDPHSLFPKFDPSWIVYQDEYILCSFKPNHLPTVPAREQPRYCLKTYLQEHLGRPLHFPSRLDMSTVGLVMVSHSEESHDRLQRLYQNRLVKKYYLLETASSVNFETLQVDAPIGRDPLHPVLRTTQCEDGKPATTKFKKLNSSEHGHFIEAEPLTGRTHQIRVHAFANGVPIVGDKFYCGAPAEELHLLSHRVCLPHPITHAPLDIRIPRNLLSNWALKADLS